jgi:hypothetical protein
VWPEHPDTLDSMRNLATTLVDLGMRPARPTYTARLWRPLGGPDLRGWQVAEPWLV